MNPRIRKIFMLLYLVAFVATVVVYFISQRNITLTWICGGLAIVFYLIYRFSKDKVQDS